MLQFKIRTTGVIKLSRDSEKRWSKLAVNQRIEQIRESERKSHMDTYSSTVLFEKGSWLSKPIKTVVDLFPYFEGKDRFRGLDLGCGIGRNCIPLAQHLHKGDFFIGTCGE